MAAALASTLGLSATGSSSAGGERSLKVGTDSGSPLEESLESQAEKAVAVRLLSDTTALVPGQSATLALEFTIAPGWNLYWRNAGDSGLPIGFEWEVPDGVSIGEARWPVPTRKVMPGDLLDYVYTDRVVLLFPVMVSPTVSPSAGSVKIEADLDWLVCREACVPGGRSVRLSVPIGSEARASDSAALIAQAERLMPREPGAGGSEAVEFKSSWKGRELTIECAGATRMVRFPYESERAWPLEMITRGAVDGPALVLEYSAGLAQEQAVRGVLQVTRGGRTVSQIVEIATGSGVEREPG